MILSHAFLLDHLGDCTKDPSALFSGLSGGGWKYAGAGRCKDQDTCFAIGRNNKTSDLKFQSNFNYKYNTYQKN